MGLRKLSTSLLICTWFQTLTRHRSRLISHHAPLGRQIKKLFFNSFNPCWAFLTNCKTKPIALDGTLTLWTLHLHFLGVRVRGTMPRQTLHTLCQHLVMLALEMTSLGLKNTRLPSYDVSQEKTWPVEAHLSIIIRGRQINKNFHLGIKAYKRPYQQNSLTGRRAQRLELCEQKNFCNWTLF